MGLIKVYLKENKFFFQKIINIKNAYNLYVPKQFQTILHMSSFTLCGGVATVVSSGAGFRTVVGWLS